MSWWGGEGECQNVLRNNNDGVINPAAFIAVKGVNE